MTALLEIRLHLRSRVLLRVIIRDYGRCILGDDTDWQCQLDFSAKHSQKNPVTLEARSNLLYWENGNGESMQLSPSGLRVQGTGAWGKEGIAVSPDESVTRVTLHTGQAFDNNTAAIIPER